MLGSPKPAALLLWERLAVVCLFTAAVGTMTGCGEDEDTKPGTEEPGTDEPGGGDTPIPDPPEDEDGNCNAGFWDHDQNKETTCVAWSICQPGTFVSAEGSEDSDRSCAPCEEGSFSDSENQASCDVWSACEQGDYIVELGSDTNDVLCEVCPDGTYDHDSNPVTACVAWDVCEAGTYVVSAGSTTANRSCQSCSAGTFTDGENQTSCAYWSTCAESTCVAGRWHLHTLPGAR